MAELEGRVIAIAGAGGGLGPVVAKRLADGGASLALADSFAGTKATANIIVVNAIETPRMREESPEGERPTFTPAEDITEAIAFLCSDFASRMNGQRLSLYP
jgi:NAD(P)-dependent dehydrogenase (short-subunit alcohol dehydrogenase family)